MAASEFKVRVKGYLPCRLTTNVPNKRGEVQVIFESNSRKWFAAEKVDRS